ncbi:unnamed protein product [Calypogeia fissa]
MSNFSGKESGEDRRQGVMSSSNSNDGNGQLETKTLAADFPEELVEKIVARLPFPSLFKARSLSRTWYFKFPLPSQCVRSLSPSLQNQVASLSSSWSTYCPVFFSQEEILGFNRVASRWQPMLTLSYLPVTNWSSITSGGSLICLISESDIGYDVYVTNVLTRSWRKLPARPFSEEPDHVRLLPVKPDSYNVLLVYRRSHDEHCVHTQVYNSSLRTWTVKKSMVDLGTFFVNSAYLDGKLFCMCRDSMLDPLQLWVYRLDDNEWIDLSHPLLPEEVVDGAFLLCGDKIFVAIWFPTERDEMNGEVIEKLSGLYTLKNNIGIFQLDLDCYHLGEVALGPPRVTVGVGVYRQQILFASDSEFIYFGQAIPSSPVLTFNVRSHEWTCLPPASYTFGAMDYKIWQEFPFEPGLNPFVMV